MRGRSSFPREYPDASRKGIAATVDAFKKLAGSPAPPAQIDSVFFNNLVITLESRFTHRSRGVEEKEFARLAKAFFDDIEKKFAD
jgi:hypothetical protein